MKLGDIKLGEIRLPAVKRPQLRSPRLLPIVIFAACSLLVFKGIGIVTNGGYVLTGVQSAVAAASQPEPAASGSAAPADAGAGANASEPTMQDSSPTLSDGAPVADAPAQTPAAPAAAAAPAVAGEVPATPAPPAGAGPADAAPPAAADGKPTSFADSLSCANGPTTAAPSPDAAPAAGAAAATNCGDAVPMKLDRFGKKVPMASADGSSLTEDTLLQRLADRRAELDKRDAELTMRESIVKAAEQQMQNRADALKALEQQIAALSDEKKSMDDDAFQGVVKMYEGMKPQDAATIFDGLDMAVLERVAKAMDPRKMSPILAKMASQRAQDLTAKLAADDPAVPTTVASTAPPNGALPQIVGH